MRVWQWLGVGVLGVTAAVAVVQFKTLAAADGGDKSAAAGTQPQQERDVKVYVYNAEGKLVGPVESPRVVKTDAEWEKQLGAKTFEVVRAKGTERPFCGTLLDNHKDGVYACVGCGLPLFSSDAKFNSGTGWPSFFKPVGDANVVEHVDRSYGMERREILCARCGGHLGHVFDDGPPPTGQRHCVNSESLKFYGKEELVKLADPAATGGGAATRPAGTQPATAPAAAAPATGPAASR